MVDVWVWVVLGAVAFAASVLAGVTGFGSAVLVLPFLIEAFGVRDAVVVLSVAQVFGNLGRVWANRRGSSGGWSAGTPSVRSPRRFWAACCSPGCRRRP